MIGARKSLMIVLVALVVGMLAGCQSSSVKDSGDATGELGEVHGSRPVDVYIDLAVAYLQQRQFQPAMQNARKALMVAPNDSSANNTMALVYQASHQVV